MASKIAGWPSSPVDHFDPEEIHPQDILDLEDAIEEANTRGGSFSDDIDSFQTQPTVTHRNLALDRPMVIKRRALPAGFMRDPEAPSFKAPTSYFPAPPFAVPPKEPPREKAPPGRNPMRRTAIQGTHQRNKSSIVTPAHHDKFTREMNAVKAGNGDEESVNSQRSGSSLLPSTGTCYSMWNALSSTDVTQIQYLVQVSL